ncbi:MAG: hypothetical protein H7222_15170 [Methylotenera sp.]|nr:hypothetical protein [Oligoflexia bacterium]
MKSLPNRFSAFSSVFLCVLVSLTSASAHATCVQKCSDSDGGVVAEVPGEVIVTQSCAAPGGSPSESREVLRDICASKKNLIEFSCMQIAPGVEVATANSVTCDSGCKPSKEGASCKSAGDPVVCHLPQCSAPPEGCTYGAPEIKKGCPVNCGPLNCAGDPVPLPIRKR